MKIEIYVERLIAAIAKILRVWGYYLCSTLTA